MIAMITNKRIVLFALFVFLHGYSVPLFAQTLYCEGLKISCEGNSSKCIAVLKKLACEANTRENKGASYQSAMGKALSEFEGPYKPKEISYKPDLTPFGELQGALQISEGCHNGDLGDCSVKADPLRLVGALVKVWKFSADTFYTVGNVLSDGGGEEFMKKAGAEPKQ